MKILQIALGARSDISGHCARASIARCVAPPPCLQARQPGHRDHRGIIRAELEPREVDLARRGAAAACSSAARSARLALTPPATTRCRDPVSSSARAVLPTSVSTMASCTPRAMSARRCASGRSAAALAHRQHHGGLQSREAELEAGAIEHGPREIERARASLLGQSRQLRPARIGQAQQFGGSCRRPRPPHRRGFRPAFRTPPGPAPRSAWCARRTPAAPDGGTAAPDPPAEAPADGLPGGAPARPAPPAHRPGCGPGRPRSAAPRPARDRPYRPLPTAPPRWCRRAQAPDAQGEAAAARGRGRPVPAPPRHTAGAGPPG